MVKLKKWKVQGCVLVKLKYIESVCDCILARDILVLKQSHCIMLEMAMMAVKLWTSAWLLEANKHLYVKQFLS